jgi:glyoxylase-like metal-dependent hydrolase (beta-lactamase superfamily II)
MADRPAEYPHPFARPPRAGAVALIGPKDLAALLRTDPAPLLLDVRSADERRFGHLPSDRHVPLESIPAAASSLPRDRPIVTYDHFGFPARRAAEYLVQQGFDRVAALEGGMDEYVRLVVPELPRYSDDAALGDLVLRQLPRPDSGCLTYFVGDPDARVAAIVDPGRDPAPYHALLKEGDWKLAAIVETHTHADHLAGHAALHAATDAPIYLSARSPATYPHRPLSEGEAVRFGDRELVVLETPGHTRDHLTLRLDRKIFTGDTLLLGACGRTDLGDGSPDLLWESLTDKILRLPDDTEVYPAHFGAHHALPDRYVSALGFERASNEALLQRTHEAFVRYMTEGWPPKPKDFDQIVRTNLEG